MTIIYDPCPYRDWTKELMQRRIAGSDQHLQPSLVHHFELQVVVPHEVAGMVCGPQIHDNKQQIIIIGFSSPVGRKDMRKPWKRLPRDIGHHCETEGFHLVQQAETSSCGFSAAVCNNLSSEA